MRLLASDKYLLIVLSLGLSMGSCHSATMEGMGGGTSGAQNTNKAPSSPSQLPAVAPSPGANSSAKPSLSSAIPLLNATYKVSASTSGGTGPTTAANSTQICQGDLAIQVNGSLGTDGNPLFNVPTGIVTCTLIGAINLQQVLGGLATQSSTGSSAAAIVSSFVAGNNVLSLPTLNGSTYTPPRPLIPSLLAASKSALENLDYVQPTVITTSSGGTDSGSIEVKMLSYDQPYAAPVIGLTFNNLADFIVTDSGFANTDKAANFLFNTMELRINTSPVAIVSIVVTGNLATFLEAAEDVGSGSGNSSGTNTNFFTGIENDVAGLFNATIELDLVAQDGLNADTPAPAPTSIGETVGGQATGN